LYRGPATPQADITPEGGEQLLQAWNAWMGKVGDALLDGGAPFRRPHRCCRRWLTTSASDLNGYTIVQAPDLAAAKTLCGGNPFLDDATADFVVESYELAPM
jgi:hypothetical protein